MTTVMELSLVFLFLLFPIDESHLDFLSFLQSSDNGGGNAATASTTVTATVDGLTDNI